ncbi:hypothetical protein [Streptomyces sp. ML-6]|uniref:hypothetical protein n=1 Tax=Streptomyces sp. ML-6 TaxID=2982693 RepID=UPI0024C02C23|nr:hypothetical protein [Streptomyces sp. ML-6]MDK0519775.1 hypothetical protein [Streptomyces sp. ML-6]
MVGTWRERADDVTSSGDTARETFLAALSVEPWFAAYVEYRAARHKRGHALTGAQRAQTALGEVQTVPEQRWYDARLLDDMVSHADRRAAELAAEFDSERGLIVTAERGTVENGAATIVGQYRTQLTRHILESGLSPSARTAIAAPEPDDDDSDVWDRPAAPPEPPRSSPTPG